MTTPTPPGWYPDPAGSPGTQRYWNGSVWTLDTFPPPPRPTAAIPAGPPLASYGLRLGGWLLDWLLVGVVSIPFLLAFGGLEHTTTMYSSNGTITHTTSFGVWGWGVLVHGLIVVAYGTLMCGSRGGQTVGMMIVGVRAVDLTAGSPIGYPRAFGRALLEYALVLLFFLPWVLDMLFPLWDPMNQTLHDKATRTIVIDRSAPSGQATN